MNTILDVKDLSIGFEHSLQKDLNFTLDKGEILFIRGRNGAGKSTLVKTLCENIKAISGTVKWVIGLDRISILPQVVSHNFPLSITLEECLSLFNPVQKIKSFLHEELLKRRFNDASGGERQKTLILTRIKDNTDVLILDEPFNHLDKKARKEIAAFISGLIHSEVIKGIILISHIDIVFKNITVKEVVLS